MGHSGLNTTQSITLTSGHILRFCPFYFSPLFDILSVVFILSNGVTDEIMVKCCGVQDRTIL